MATAAGPVSLTLTDRKFESTSGNFQFPEFYNLETSQRIVGYVQSSFKAIAEAYELLWRIRHTMLQHQTNSVVSINVSLGNVNFTVTGVVNRNPGKEFMPSDQDITETTITPKRLSGVIAVASIAAISAAKKSNRDLSGCTTINPLCNTFLQKPAAGEENFYTKLIVYHAYVIGVEFVACYFPFQAVCVCTIKLLNMNITGGKNKPSDMTEAEYCFQRVGVKKVTVGDSVLTVDQWLGLEKNGAELAAFCRSYYHQLKVTKKASTIAAESMAKTMHTRFQEFDKTPAGLALIKKRNTPTPPENPTVPNTGIDDDSEEGGEEVAETEVPSSSFNVIQAELARTEDAFGAPPTAPAMTGMPISRKQKGKQ